MKPRVLIVDDEANIRRMLAALLKAEGFETEEAAIRMARLQDPFGVPTATERGVDLEAAGRWREHHEDLLRQHRQVPFLHQATTIEGRI